MDGLFRDIKNLKCQTAYSSRSLKKVINSVGQPDGVAPLDGDGKVPEEYLPELSKWQAVATLGVGLSSALPESPEIGDTFVTTDTLQLYTRIDSVSWSFVDLPDKAFVTDNTGDRAVLYQRIGTVLVVISSDTYDSITINGDIAVGGTVDGRDVSEDGSKLDGIEEGAQVNVNADWDSVSGDSKILNKPTDVTDLSTHASSELSDGSDIVKNAGTSTYNAIARFDGITGKVVQDSGAYIDDDGNVGIATNNPTERLHVVGNVLSSGNVRGATLQVSNKVIMEYDTNTDTLEFNFI